MPARPHVVTLVTLVTLVTVGPARAGSPPAGASHADDPVDPNRTPFTVDLALDIPLTLGVFFVGGIPRVLEDEIVRPWCALNCDPADVNFIDREVIGANVPLAGPVADGLFGASMVLPFVLGAIDTAVSDPVDGWGGYGVDALILTQTLAFTLAVNNLLSLVVRRPRPYAYDTNRSEEVRTEPAATFSFPSGHTAAAVAMAMAYSTLFTERHPESPAVYPVWIGTFGIALATGALRTRSGSHFWTDVITGVVLGATIGWLVPYVHLRDDAEDADGGDDAPTGPTTLSVLPAAFDGGFGAVITVR